MAAKEAHALKQARCLIISYIIIRTVYVCLEEELCSGCLMEASSDAPVQVECAKADKFSLCEDTTSTFQAENNDSNPEEVVLLDLRWSNTSSAVESSAPHNPGSHGAFTFLSK